MIFTEYVETKENFEENINYMLIFFPFFMYFLLIDSEPISNIIAQIAICLIRIFSISTEKFTVHHVLNNCMTVILFAVFIFLFHKSNEANSLIEREARLEENIYKDKIKHLEEIQKFLAEKDRHTYGEAYAKEMLRNKNK